MASCQTSAAGEMQPISSPMLNAKRLAIARARRHLTTRALADQAGIEAKTIAGIEKGNALPQPDSIGKLAQALDYPPEFLTGDDVDEVESGSVSFRSFSRMTAKERNAALASGTLGLMLSQWLEERFNMPKPDLLDLSHVTDPEIASTCLRQHWTLGGRPIDSLLGLLETKGVRVFSFSENTSNVNAFSFWKGGVPFVFLNNFKSAENSRFDMAHELGHLVLHAREDPKGHHILEREADQFAATFLMPSDGMKAHAPMQPYLGNVIELAKLWRVSAVAMAKRLFELRLLPEWHYRSICIELTQNSYRRFEPGGMEREISPLWKKVLTMLWQRRITKEDIARDLYIPFDEFEMLVDSLAPDRPQLPQDGTHKLHSVVG